MRKFGGAADNLLPPSDLTLAELPAWLTPSPRPLHDDGALCDDAWLWLGPRRFLGSSFRSFLLLPLSWPRPLHELMSWPSPSAPWCWIASCLLPALLARRPNQKCKEQHWPTLMLAFESFDRLLNSLRRPPSPDARSTPPRFESCPHCKLFI